MTTATRIANPRGLGPFLLAAFVALTTLLGGAGTASAVTGSHAGNRVGASTPAVVNAVGAGQGITAGQQLGNKLPGLVSVVATGVAAKGGAGPVLKGQAGVNQVAADIEAAGGKVLGREITVEANGVRTRPDLFVEDACGNRCFVEVKTGPSARLTKNQSSAFPWIQSQGFIPRGGNAAAAGFTPGMSYGPMPVWTVHLP